jgi:hypothetical protein
LSPEVSGKLLCVTTEDGLAKQSADAMPGSGAVLRKIHGSQVQIAESLSRHATLSSNSAITEGILA